MLKWLSFEDLFAMFGGIKAICKKQNTRHVTHAAPRQPRLGEFRYQLILYLLNIYK